MDIVSEIIGHRDSLAAGTALDPLHLTAEQRASGHLAVTTEGGVRVRISLPRGTELQDGDVLAEADGKAIVVSAAPEDLFRLWPGEDAPTWAGACWQLGNLHRQMRFTKDGALTPRDAMVARFLDSIGQPYEPVHAPFIGHRIAGDQAHRQGHDHHGDHSHSHRGEASHSHAHSHSHGAHSHAGDQAHSQGQDHHGDHSHSHGGGASHSHAHSHSHSHGAHSHAGVQAQGQGHEHHGGHSHSHGGEASHSHAHSHSHSHGAHSHAGVQAQGQGHEHHGGHSHSHGGDASHSHAHGHSHSHDPHVQHQHGPEK